MTAFEGFPAEGLAFLDELAANNNRDWFHDNKQRYIDLLRDPAIALVIAIGEKLKTISPDIVYDTRTNGAGSLMRVNRDTRFSPDKTPYKDHVDMVFWEGPEKKMQNPSFGFRIRREDMGMYAGMHGFDKDMLAAYRLAVADDDLGVELLEAVSAVESAGDYEIGGEHYKRVPRGYDADHPRAKWLKHNGLFATSGDLDRTPVTSPDLPDIIFAHFQKMAPIQQWLVKVAARK